MNMKYINTFPSLPMTHSLSPASLSLPLLSLSPSLFSLSLSLPLPVILSLSVTVIDDDMQVVEPRILGNIVVK